MEGRGILHPWRWELSRGDFSRPMKEAGTKQTGMLPKLYKAVILKFLWAWCVITKKMDFWLMLLNHSKEYVKGAAVKFF
jgi:hypothetical protein